MVQGCRSSTLRLLALKMRRVLRSPRGMARRSNRSRAPLPRRTSVSQRRPDSTGIRVIFPDLTAERRQMFAKLVKEKLEEARISIRKEREKTWNEIQDAKKGGTISEDEMFTAKDDLQKLVDEANAKLEASADKKEAELLN
jgi:ribosome recycling factor